MTPLRLRDATWGEVVALFQGDAAKAAANARGWALRYGLPVEDYAQLPVTLEAWSHERLAHALAAMATVEPRMVIDMHGATNNAQLPPRVDGLPAVVLRFGNRLGMIDGKHRAHRWRHVPGRYAVLVIESRHG